LLGVDILESEYHFQASTEAKTEQVAAYFIELVKEYHHRGKSKLDIFLDRNTTHKNKMWAMVLEATRTLPIAVRFHLMPAYSPKLNPVEYAIHVIRLKVFHHADCKDSLPEFQRFVKDLCDSGKIFSKEQIINLLGHIEDLVLEFVNLSPKRG
jgi:transposase